MVLFTVFTMSCERDTWFTDLASRGSGQPVNVLLSFEVPQADEVAVTRTMSELEEHNIKDLYVLIFDAEDADHGFPLISRQYFDENALNVTKVNHVNGEWSSVLDGEGNSTHGIVMAKALEKNCFIFGVANVRGADSEVARSEETSYSKLDDALLAMKTVSDPSPTTLANFYSLQAELKNNISLGRNDAHLLMSGVFVPKDIYKPEGYDAYNSKYQRGVAGLVDIGQTNIVRDLKDENGNVDLTKAGVIRLRRVSSHITFKIKINEDGRDLNGDGVIDDKDKVFSDFKPESWRVLHLPRRSYLMDQGDEKLKITGDGNFNNSTPQNSMIHVDGNYKFDFYMYENHKEARDIHNIDTKNTGWDEFLTDNDKKTIVTGYYQPQFGYTIVDTDTDGGNSCKKLSSDVYNNDAHAFKYAKRELALKDNNGEYITKDDSTKQFVYIEPNATYVEIKGRLLFNTELFKLTDLIKRGGTDRSTDQAIKDGYADVTYLIHLGYARGRSIKDEVKGEGSESDDYKMSDFNSLRNTEYTYNIEIRGVNTIFTQVVTESPDDKDKRESAKMQTGASGFIGMVTENVYNTDAHFNAFNIFLDVGHLDVDNFFFEINTPWSVIQSSQMNDTDYNTPSSKSYKYNTDLTWIKVRRNLDQTFGNNETEYVKYLDANGTQHRTTMPYFKQKGALSDDNYENTYHFKSNPLIDLYQLKKELAKLSTSGLPITLKEGNTVKSYTAKMVTETVSGSPVKVLNYYDGDTKKGTLQGLFYTVYLDEYYYHTPPVDAAWSTPYWHEFVNTPARYVSFGSNAVVNTGTTHDHESSMMKPQLMIVQPSIQTHYATDGGIIVGLGMEHYNETPHPRWADNGPGGTIGMSFTKERKKYGWLNAKDYIVDKANVTWDGYVADYVGLYNNLTMVPNLVNDKVPDVKYQDKTDNDAQYKAGAIRLCMNRNRDENGNGVIDENELKWYLPASSQLDIISMCHYSFYDPLLNYNDYITGKDSDGNITYRLKNYKGNYSDLTGHGDMYGGNFYQFHYVTSDYMKLTSEEMMNLNKYGTTGAWIYGPGEMRCVRNLGEESGDAHTGKQVLKPYFYYDADGKVDMDDSRTELQTYTGAIPNIMFEFRYRETTKNGKKVFTDKIFIMEKYMDSRSVRTAKYENEELPPHYLFSEINRPYKAFKVAENLVTMDFGTWKKQFGNSWFIDLKDIYYGRPCGDYWEETDPDDPNVHPDKGSWRAPNAAEISLMIHQLRITNDEGKPVDKEPYLFFDKNATPFPFTCTSWNFARKLWVRMVAIKNEDPRKLWMSDPYKATATEAKTNFNYTQATDALYNNSVPLRCVKDIEPPVD